MGLSEILLSSTFEFDTDYEVVETPRERPIIRETIHLLLYFLISRRRISRLIKQQGEAQKKIERMEYVRDIIRGGKRFTVKAAHIVINGVRKIKTIIFEAGRKIREIVNDTWQSLHDAVEEIFDNLIDVSNEF